MITGFLILSTIVAHLYFHDECDYGLSTRDIVILFAGISFAFLMGFKLGEI